MFKIFLFILATPFVAQANICGAKTDLQKIWQEQKTWEKFYDFPSSENPEFSFPIYKNQQGQQKTGSLEIRGTVLYKSEIKLGFSNDKHEKFFAKQCGKANPFFIYLEDGNAPGSSDNGSFRIKISFLPSYMEGKDIPLSEIKYSIGFNSDSVTSQSAIIGDGVADGYKNDAVYSLKYLRSVIYEQINLHLGEQLKPYKGSIEINLDGFQGVVCDLLRNKARLIFRHSGSREIDYVKKRDIFESVEFKNWYQDISEGVDQLKSVKAKEFLLGFRWEDKKNKEETTKFSSTVAPLFVELAQLQKVEGLNDSQLQCVAERAADYSQNDRFFNEFEIITQTLDQVGGE